MKDIPIKFEEFGVGNLMKNNFIMKIFNFYSNSNNTTGSNGSNNITITKSMLPIITTSDILQILHEFIMKNHTTTAAYHGKAMNWEALELKFMEYLKALYKPTSSSSSTGTTTSSSIVLGIDIDFKPIYLSTTRVRTIWFQELRNAKDKISAQYKEALTDMFQKLFQNNQNKIKNLTTSTSTTTTTNNLLKDNLLTINIDINNIYKNLTKFGMKPFNEYMKLVQHCMEHKKNRSFFFSIASITTKSNHIINNITLNTINNILIMKDEYKSVELHSIPMNNARKCLIAAIVGLTMHLMSIRTTENDIVSAVNSTVSANNSSSSSNNNNGSNGSSISIWCLQHLCSDIPIVCINATQNMLVKLLQPDMLIVEESEEKKNIYPDTMRVDWNVLSRSVELLLGDETNSSSGKCSMSPSTYIGIVTAVVLFQRLVAASLVEVSTTTTPTTTTAGVVVENEDTQLYAEITTDITTRLQALLESPTRSPELVYVSQTAGPLARLFQALAIVESEVTLQRNLPVFECTRTGGSFLYFLQQQLVLQLEPSTEKSTTSATDCNHTAVMGLIDALKLLQSMLFPAPIIVPDDHDSSAAYIQESHEVSSGGAVDVYERIAAVQTQLLSVLTSRELALSRDSATTSECVSIFDMVVELLLEIEAEVITEDSSMIATMNGGSNTLPSFLKMIGNVLSEDSEIANRLNALIQQIPGVGANQSEEVLSHNVCMIQVRILLLFSLL